MTARGKGWAMRGQRGLRGKAMRILPNLLVVWL